MLNQQNGSQLTCQNRMVSMQTCEYLFTLQYISVYFVTGGLKNTEGPLGGSSGLLAYMQGSATVNTSQLPPLQTPDWIARSAVSAMGAIPQYGAMSDGQRRRKFDEETLELLSNEMSFSALYMHEIHRRRVMNQDFDNYEDMHARAIWQTSPRNEQEQQQQQQSPSTPEVMFSPSDNVPNMSSSRSNPFNTGPPRGRALSAVTEASFKTADGEEEEEINTSEQLQGAGSQLQEEQPLLLHQLPSSQYSTS